MLISMHPPLEVLKNYIPSCNTESSVGRFYAAAAEQHFHAIIRFEMNLKRWTRLQQTQSLAPDKS